MLAAPGQILVRHVAEPSAPRGGEALVRVLAAGICGSDLWAFNGVAERPAMQPIGHEFVGVVAAVGDEVKTLQPGDEVAAPFSWSCAECEACGQGWTSSCVTGGFFGRTKGADGAQSDYVRVPHADGTLFPLPKDTLGEHALRTNILLCGDVIATGRHAAELGGVGEGDRCVVVGDGSVGLAAASMARRAGAAHVTLIGHHEKRMARCMEADVTVLAQDEPGLDAVRRRRPDAVLDCVGTALSTRQAVSLVSDGGRVGVVGVPHGVGTAPVAELFRRNIGIRFGITPARTYMRELVGDVLAGSLDLSWLVDLEMSLDDVAQGYRAMAERRTIKVQLRP